MEGLAGKTSVCVSVEPGICGFPCVIEAGNLDSRNVSLKITDSDCEQIQRLSERLNAISLKELFMPLTRNPIYVSAEKSGCHPSCPVPLAIVKAVEVARDMAIPKDIRIRFEPCDGKVTDGK